MKRWDRVLVTGASAGIGRSMAELAAGQGSDLVIVARDTARLEELAGDLVARYDVTVEVLTADLSTAAGVETVSARIAVADDPVDLVVNNAGLGFTGDVVDIGLDNERTMVAVNVTALHHLACVAAAALAERGGGGILNVSSVAGFGPAPQTATYAATKAFVNSFSEGLHVEMKPKGVTVTALCPGYTRTEFHQRADYDVSQIPDFLFASAQSVAQAGLDGVAAGRAVVVPGALNRVAAAGLKVVPRQAVRSLAGRVSRTTGR
jgi:short-subunit dehydrogenase